MLGSSPEKTMRELVIEYGGKFAYGEKERWCRRIARELSAGRTKRISPRMIEAAHDNEITQPDHWLGARIKEALRLRNEAATREANELAGKFKTIAHAMQQTDPDFYSKDIAALVNAARILSGLDRS